MKKKRGPTAQGFLDNIKRRVRTTVGDHFIEQLLLLLASGSLTAVHLCRDALSSPVWQKISCLNTHSNETSTPADTQQTGCLSQELELNSHYKRSQNSLSEQGGKNMLGKNIVSDWWGQKLHQRPPSLLAGFKFRSLTAITWRIMWSLFTRPMKRCRPTSQCGEATEADLTYQSVCRADSFQPHCEM